MKLALSATAVGLLILLSACGGGSDTVTVTFRPEIPETTSDLNTAAILDATVGTIRRRAELYGLDVPEISVSGDMSIAITVDGIDAATAVELFGRQAQLEFKRPKLSVEGIVACTTASGELFGVLPQNVNPDAASRSAARCVARDKVGDPIWDPAVANGEELTAQSIQTNGWEARENALAARFTPGGASTLELLTEELAGYPLGIFLDGELVAAPRINRAITNSDAVISGIDGGTARVRAAQLNAGPTPVRLVLVAGPSPAP